MKRISCLIMFVLCLTMPGLSFAQKLSPKEIEEQTLADFGTTKEAMERFHRDVMQNVTKFQEGLQARIMKESSQPGASEEKVRDMAMNGMIEIGNIMQETSKKHFSNEQHQKMQLRMFQAMRSVRDNAMKSNDPADTIIAQGIPQAELMKGRPDFLNLTDKQQQEIQEIQKETFKSIQMTTQKYAQLNMNPDRQKIIMGLEKKMQDAKTDEERQEIGQKLRTIHIELLKDAVPEFKRLLKEGRDKFDAVLTDAQRAKIEEVMDQVPEYLWQQLPQNQGKDRPWRPGLNSWMPGMGAPEGTDDIREARPEPKEKNRRFPGNNSDE